MAIAARFTILSCHWQLGFVISTARPALTCPIPHMFADCREHHTLSGGFRADLPAAGYTTRGSWRHWPTAEWDLGGSCQRHCVLSSGQALCSCGHRGDWGSSFHLLKQAAAKVSKRGCAVGHIKKSGMVDSVAGAIPFCESVSGSMLQRHMHGCIARYHTHAHMIWAADGSFRSKACALQDAH